MLLIIRTPNIRKTEIKYDMMSSMFPILPAFPMANKEGRLWEEADDGMLAAR
jgi:hypothetical protein